MRVRLQINNIIIKYNYKSLIHFIRRLVQKSIIGFKKMVSILMWVVWKNNGLIKMFMWASKNNLENAFLKMGRRRRRFVCKSTLLNNFVGLKWNLDVGNVVVGLWPVDQQVGKLFIWFYEKIYACKKLIDHMLKFKFHV